MLFVAGGGSRMDTSGEAGPGRLLHEHQLGDGWYWVVAIPLHTQRTSL